MAAAADRLHNPIQRDTVAFLRTAAQSGGESLLLEVELEPRGRSRLHRHLRATETVEVVEGELALERGKEHLTLRPGDRAVVPPGAAHRVSNRTGAAVRFLVELRPPGRLEEALRIGYGLAAEGRVQRNGTPRSVLQAALLSARADTYATTSPVLLQRLVTLPLALLARALGVERSFRRYL